MQTDYWLPGLPYYSDLRREPIIKLLHQQFNMSVTNNPSLINHTVKVNVLENKSSGLIELKV